MRLFASAVGLLVAASLACQASPLGGRTSDVASDPEVLFQDDFSARSSGNWDTSTDADSRLEIQAGSLRMQIGVPQRLIWSTPGQAFTDVRVEVDATMLAGPDAAEYGVICRYSEDPVGSHSFYYLVVAGDTNAAIVKVVDNEQIALTSRDLAFDEVVGGNASNHIMAECIGDSISLLVNGTKLLTQLDDDLPSGDVGVIATTAEEAGMSVLFDNFVVRRPRP